MKAKFFGALAATMALGLASPATSAIVTATYAGTVAAGSFDLDGIFGPPGSNLEGGSYVARYVFNTAKGYSYSSPDLNYVDGGSVTGFESPVVRASVTINGHSVWFAGTHYGAIYGANGHSAYGGGYYAQQSHKAVDSSFNGNIETFQDSYSQFLTYSNSPIQDPPASITSDFTTRSCGQTVFPNRLMRDSRLLFGESTLDSGSDVGRGMGVF